MEQKIYRIKELILFNPINASQDRNSLISTPPFTFWRREANHLAKFRRKLLILKQLFDRRYIEQIYRNKPTVVKCAPVIENTRKLFGLLERFNANKADGYAFGGAEAAYLIYPLTDEWHWSS